MKQLTVTAFLLIIMGCSPLNKVKMETKTQNKVGKIVLVMSKTKPEYSQREVIELSKDIDPMVDEFEGYLGRKMAFSTTESDLMIDVVYYENQKAIDEAIEKEMKSEICLRFFESLDAETERMLTFSPMIMSEPKAGEAKVIELVLFKLKSGITSEEFTNAAESVQGIIEGFDGFVSRKLALTEDGQWMDLVYWTSLEKAEAAASEVMKNETFQTFAAMIDESTMEFKHFNIVIDTER